MVLITERGGVNSPLTGGVGCDGGGVGGVNY